MFPGYSAALLSIYNPSSLHTKYNRRKSFQIGGMQLSQFACCCTAFISSYWAIAIATSTYTQIIYTFTLNRVSSVYCCNEFASLLGDVKCLLRPFIRFPAQRSSPPPHVLRSTLVGFPYVGGKPHARISFNVFLQKCLVSQLLSFVEPNTPNYIPRHWDIPILEPYSNV